MIVSAGEALVDLVPHPVPGGGPMNVAVAAARLDVPAAFVGRVSTDVYGDQIWEHLRSNNVDLRLCERGPEPTARAIVEHTPRQAFRFEGEDTADTNLAAVDLARLGAGPHILHGGTLGLYRGRTAETLAAVAERHGGVVSLDPNVRPQIVDDRDRWDHFHRRWVERTHIYKVSNEDLDWIWPGRQFESCAEELLAGTAVAVMVTRGVDGVTVYLRGEELAVPGEEVDVVDTVGAGDTFVASVLASIWDRGLGGSPDRLSELVASDWVSIARRAVAAATITCTRAGADPPTLDELDSRA